MRIIWTIEFDALTVNFDLYDQDMPVTLLEDPVRDDRIMRQPAGRMKPTALRFCPTGIESGR